MYPVIDFVIAFNFLSIGHYENLANLLVSVIRAIIAVKHSVFFYLFLESLKSTKNVYWFTFI